MYVFVTCDTRYRSWRIWICGTIVEVLASTHMRSSSIVILGSLYLSPWNLPASAFRSRLQDHRAETLSSHRIARLQDPCWSLCSTPFGWMSFSPPRKISRRHLHPSFAESPTWRFRLYISVDSRFLLTLGYIPICSEVPFSRLATRSIRTCGSHARVDTWIGHRRSREIYIAEILGLISPFGL